MFQGAAQVLDAVISIHALLAESDLMWYQCNTVVKEFLSTLSLRRATPCNGYCIQRSGYFYPRSPCGERPEAEDGYKDTVTISIHALLAESDMIAWSPDRQTRAFLSTLSLRRATDRQRKRHPHALDFYPRSPCGERLGAVLVFDC